MNYWRKNSCSGWEFSPNSEVREPARPGRGGTRLAFRIFFWRAMNPSLELFMRRRVFREGAENRARCGRSPFSISNLSHRFGAERVVLTASGVL